MNCPNCGNPISDNATFCGSCGTAINAQPVQPVQPVQPAYNAQPVAQDNPYAKSALIMGIVGAALSWLPVVSIILGIITIKKARYAMSMAPQLGKKPICIVALVLGIESIVCAAIMTIYWPILIGAAACASEVASNSYYYYY